MPDLKSIAKKIIRRGANNPEPWPEGLDDDDGVEEGAAKKPRPRGGVKSPIKVAVKSAGNGSKSPSGKSGAAPGALHSDAGKGIERAASELITPRKPREPSVEEVSRQELRSKPYYSEDVLLKMYNLVFDPIAMDLFKAVGIDADEAHLLGLTRINDSREAWHWAGDITREAMYAKYVKGVKCDWPASRIMRVAFLIARRSIPGVCGPGFTIGAGAASEQSISKTEEAGEEAIYGND